MLRKAFNLCKDLGRWHMQVTGVVHFGLLNVLLVESQRLKRN